MSGRKDGDERRIRREESERNRLIEEDEMTYFGPLVRSCPFPDLVGGVELMLLFGRFWEGGL